MLKLLKLKSAENVSTLMQIHLKSECVCVFQVGQGYPHDPPKVKCETMVYHPNIDLEGNVCLNILRSVSF